MSFDARLLTGVGVMAAVDEAGNFAKAAEILGLTPSGVSRAVARLEARVGVRLFDRSPRSVSLTEEGRRFHAQVLPLLAGLEEAASEAAGAAATVSGRLRVNVDPWFARMILAPRIPRPRPAWPGAGPAPRMTRWAALLQAIRYRFPWLRHIFADGGYAGGKLRDALKGPRLARPLPTPRQGLGENHRKLQRLDSRRQHQAPLTQ